MKQKFPAGAFFVAAGSLLLLAGVGTLHLNPGHALSYVLLGVGCGLLGQGIGQWVQQKVLRKYPDTAHALTVAAHDERNVAIANQSKARAFDLMTFVFGIVMLCFALMNVDWPVILLLVGAYLLVEGYAVYYRIKLEKEM